MLSAAVAGVLGYVSAVLKEPTGRLRDTGRLVPFFTCENAELATLCSSRNYL